MSQTVNFPRDTTLQAIAEKMDTQNMFLAGLLSAQEGAVRPTSFKQVQTLVRAGLASKVFHIGDQITCNKDDKTLVWDVIGIDHDTPADKQYKHSLTLQLHDCYTSLQYDASEALFACENELPAGTYNFTLLSGYDATYGGGKTYQFTLANPVPAGGQICFPWAYNTQASTTHVKTYANSTSNTVIDDVTVEEGTAGTSLGTADGNTPHMNHTHRIRYGSNNWVESAMRQWLNSDKAAGSVWNPQTEFDRPPIWVSNTEGWMNGMDADFLDVIGKTEKVTCRNTVTDDGGSDVTTDKFFLLSRREVYMGNEVGSVIEGEPYPYYSDYSDLSAPGTGNDSNRIKYRNGTAQYWWLRTPYAGYGNNVRIGTTAGELGNYNANHSFGVAPACNII